MSLSKLNENLNNVSSLPDKPSLQSDELKKVFDESGNVIKTYINEVLTKELDELINASVVQRNSNTARLDNMFNLVYPVGSIYMSVNSINPSEIFGGTWVAWGDGRAVVGIDASQTEFNAVEKTGGAKTHTLTTAQMPAHSHAFHGYSHNHNLNGHTHSIPALSGYTDWKDLQGRIWNMAVQSDSVGMSAEGIAYLTGGSGYSVGYAPSSSRRPSEGVAYTDEVGLNASHSHNVATYENITGQAWGNTSDTTVGGYNDNNGENQAHNNLQPYITCYMWKRTA